MVGEVDVSSAANGQAEGQIQARRGCSAVVAGIARRPVSRQGGDDPGSGCDFPDPVVVLIRYIKVPCAVDGHARGGIQARRAGRPVVSGIACRPAPRYGGDDSGPGGHLPDTVIVLIGDKEVPAAVKGHARGAIEARCRRLAVVSGIASRPVPRNGGDNSGPDGDHPDPVVTLIGDVQVAGAVHSHAWGIQKARRGCRAVVADVSTRAACKGDDVAKGGLPRDRKEPEQYRAKQQKDCP